MEPLRLSSALMDPIWMEYKLDCAVEMGLVLVDCGVESCQFAEVHNYVHLQYIIAVVS